MQTKTRARFGPLLLVVGVLVTVGCGDAPPSKADRTRAALEALFEAARAGDVTRAAAAIVYQGEDEARAWKDVFDPARPGDQTQAAKAVSDLRRHVGTTTKAFLEFRSERESEVEWLSWRVETDAGTAWYSCLDINGVIALGDVD